MEISKRERGVIYTALADYHQQWLRDAKREANRNNEEEAALSRQMADEIKALMNKFYPPEWKEGERRGGTKL